MNRVSHKRLSHKQLSHKQLSQMRLFYRRFTYERLSYIPVFMMYYQIARLGKCPRSGSSLPFGINPWPWECSYFPC